MPVPAEGVGVGADQAVVGAQLRAAAAAHRVVVLEVGGPDGRIILTAVPGVDPVVEVAHPGMLVMAHHPQAEAVYGRGYEHAVDGQAVLEGHDHDVHGPGAQRVQVGAVAASEADVQGLAAPGGIALQQFVLVAGHKGLGRVGKRGELQHAADVRRALVGCLGGFPEERRDARTGDQEGGDGEGDGFFPGHGLLAGASGGLGVERPVDAELQAVHAAGGHDVAVRAEVVHLAHGPAAAGILVLDEHAGAFPLDVDEDVEEGAVGVEAVGLVVEDAQVGVPGRSVPGRIVVRVGTDLHHHDVAPPFVALHDELQVIPEVQRQGGQRDDLRLGRNLQQGTVVQVYGAQHELLAERGGQDAHRGTVLPGDALRVVIDGVAEQGVAHVGGEVPVGDVEPPADGRGGNLVEIVVPAEVVQVEVLLVPAGLQQRGAEAGRQADRALAGAPERIEAELGVRLHLQVADVGAQDHETGLGVPEGVAPELPFRTGVQIHGILHVRGRPDGGAVEVVFEVVADAHVQLGDDPFAGPRLQPQVHLVVQAHRAQGVHAGRAVAEHVVVEGGAGVVGNGVGIAARPGGPLGAMADEGGRDVAVQAVGVEAEGAVAPGAHPADEGEGDAQLLVQEEGALLRLGTGTGQVHADVAAVHGGVADPADVGDAAVAILLPPFYFLSLT